MNLFVPVILPPAMALHLSPIIPGLSIIATLALGLVTRPTAPTIPKAIFRGPF